MGPLRIKAVEALQQRDAQFLFNVVAITLCDARLTDHLPRLAADEPASETPVELVGQVDGLVVVGSFSWEVVRRWTCSVLASGSWGGAHHTADTRRENFTNAIS